MLWDIGIVANRRDSGRISGHFALRPATLQNQDTEVEANMSRQTIHPVVEVSMHVRWEGEESALEA
jgi:hypothetical protein